MLFAVTTWQNLALCCFAASLLVNTETVYSQTLVEAGIDTRRDRAYVKVEAESARVIDRSNKAHPAFDAGNTEGPGLHYEVLGPKVAAPRKMPARASGDKALFNVGTGEQTEVEGQRNSVYKPHEAPPLGTIAEYRVRFRQAGVYELFLRLAYWSESETKPDLGLHWAAHSNANGIGAIHVKDYASGRLLNSDWWRRHNNSAWNLKEDAWTVVDFGPALEVRPEDLSVEGYVDVVWQISASHPGLIIDSFVMYQNYSIDPSASKYEQSKAYADLSMSSVAKP